MVPGAGLYINYISITYKVNLILPALIPTIEIAINGFLDILN